MAACVSMKRKVDQLLREGGRRTTYKKIDIAGTINKSNIFTVLSSLNIHDSCSRILCGSAQILAKNLDEAGGKPMLLFYLLTVFDGKDKNMN